MFERPWGHYETIETTDDYQIKSLHIKAGHRLSLQIHQHRAEHWFCVSGKGSVIIDEDEFEFNPGDSFDILPKTVHRVSAIEDLVFIEVQTGKYFGEDDIVRLQDDYNRN
jgi:mannose-6-phosphate isomerase-like protein (cupin superfamily)